MKEKRMIFKNKAFIPILLLACFYCFVLILSVCTIVNYAPPRASHSFGVDFYCCLAIVALLVIIFFILYLIFGIINRESKLTLIFGNCSLVASTTVLFAVIGIWGLIIDIIIGVPIIVGTVYVLIKEKKCWI